MNNQINYKLCPFIKKPFNDCYCFNLTSRTINPAIHYCSNNFDKCEIYNNNYLNNRKFNDKQILSLINEEEKK